MKIYTQTYDLAKASPHRFWVAPYSEFKIGIKLLEKDEISDKDFTLKAGSVEFTPDEDKIDNFTLFTIKSNDTGFVEYTIEVEGVAEKLKLMQIVTDSTVFEIDASGGDVPADVATQTWVNSQISDFVEEDELTAYATKAELTGYVENDDLTAYAEKTDLTAYYTKSETSSAAELADAFAGAGGGAISAFDLSESPVWSKTQVEAALANNICLPQTIALNTDNSISVVDVSGTLSVSWTEGFINTRFLFPDAKKIIVGTKVNKLYGYTGSNYELILPNTLTAFDNASRMLGSNISCLNIPNSVTGIDSLLSFSSGTKIVDFGNTRTTIALLDSTYNVGSDIEVYVPDNLYDTWIAASNWSDIASQIHRHSELEAPYLYSSKVTGGAETGTTGTPAAVNAVKSVYETDWATLSATADANTFYVVLPDPV